MPLLNLTVCGCYKPVQIISLRFIPAYTGGIYLAQSSRALDDVHRELRKWGPLFLSCIIWFLDCLGVIQLFSTHSMYIFVIIFVLLLVQIPARQLEEFTAGEISEEAENLPETQPLLLSVNENVPVGTIIGRIHDIIGFLNSTPLTFTIPMNPYFGITAGGDIQVLSELDRDTHVALCEREKYPEHCVWSALAIGNNGHYVMIHIEIKDVNDNSPQWPVRTIVIQVVENAERPVLIELPHASDSDLGKNGVTSYKIDMPVEYNSIFRLSYVDPMISLKNVVDQHKPGPTLEVLVPLDRERQEIYNLTLEAVDGSYPFHTGSLSLIVEVQDVNDNTPIFINDPYMAMISEELEVGAEVKFLKNTARTNYNITSFSTDANTQHMFATDRDTGSNGQVEYTFAKSTEPAVLETFSINRLTGHITLLKKLHYDSDPRKWHFMVMATDNGQPVRSAITRVSINLIDANSHDPEIKVRLHSNYHDHSKRITSDPTQDYHDRMIIMENVPPVPRPLATLTVTDRDTGAGGRFDCSIVEPGVPSNSHQKIYFSDHFTLNFTARVPGWKVYNLFVIDRLDREAQNDTLLKVSCADHGKPPRTSAVDIEVEITDENDNEPKFEKNVYYFSIKEGNKPNAIVGHVLAEDADSGNNGRVFYEIQQVNSNHLLRDLFHINQNGNIRVNKILDRENSSDHYEFTVIAKDHGEPIPLSATTRVNLTIEDINDCSPTFGQKYYNFSIKEDYGANFSSGRLVGEVKAVDGDLGLYGMITYKIVDPGVPFQITSSGAIKTTGPIDREIRSKYRLTILAVDGSQASQNSSVNMKPISTSQSNTAATQVWITVEDLNDNFPQFVNPNAFEKRKFKLTVSAREKWGFVIARLMAIDKDVRTNGLVSYTLKNEAKSELFGITKWDGEVYVNADLMDHINETIQLVAVAQDQGEPSKSCTVDFEVALADSPPLGPAAAYPPHNDLQQIGTMEINRLIVMSILICTAAICAIMLLVIGLLIRRRGNCRGCVRNRWTSKRNRRNELYEVDGPEIKEERVAVNLAQNPEYLFNVSSSQHATIQGDLPESISYENNEALLEQTNQVTANVFNPIIQSSTGVNYQLVTINRFTHLKNQNASPTLEARGQNSTCYKHLSDSTELATFDTTVPTVCSVQLVALPIGAVGTSLSYTTNCSGVGHNGRPNIDSDVDSGRGGSLNNFSAAICIEKTNLRENTFVTQHHNTLIGSSPDSIVCSVFSNEYPVCFTGVTPTTSYDGVDDESTPLRKNIASKQNNGMQSIMQRNNPEAGQAKLMPNRESKHAHKSTGKDGPWRLARHPCDKSIFNE